MTPIDHLLSIEPPWVEFLILSPRQSSRNILEQLPALLGILVHGENCKTKTALFSEFKRSLAFPPYFGENWDAFEECITDLEWLPAKGYLIVISQAEYLLIDNETDYGIFVSVMQEAGKTWATPQSRESQRPAIPFHTILTVRDTEKMERRKWNIPVLKLD